MHVGILDNIQPYRTRKVNTHKTTPLEQKPRHESLHIIPYGLSALCPFGAEDPAQLQDAKTCSEEDEESEADAEK